MEPADPNDGGTSGFMANGRKFALSVVFLSGSMIIVFLGFILALKNAGQIAEFVKIANTWIATGAGVVTIFMGTNAYITSKTAETSAPTKAPIDPDRPTAEQPKG